MCGLCGYFLQQTPKDHHARILKGLLLANSTRGTDSTGVAYCGTQTTVYKDIQTAFKFIQSLPANEAKIALGHTRYATIGAVTQENAHPITKGHITGVHNGMVSNYLEINPTVKVDSEVIFELINEVGYKKAFKRLSGSMALAWVDDRTPGTLYLMRHDNPLFLARMDNDYIFSSQDDHLFPILAQHAGQVGMVELKADTVYVLDLTGIAHHAVTFKPYVMPNYGGGYKGQEMPDNLDEIFNPEDGANPYRSIYDDTRHTKEENAQDIGQNDGCCYCGSIIEGYGYMDDEGYLYCPTCGQSFTGLQYIRFE
jgi:asparagine synthetase B (glutamine-hydrolysing)